MSSKIERINLLKKEKELFNSRIDDKILQIQKERNEYTINHAEFEVSNGIVTHINKYKSNVHCHTRERVDTYFGDDGNLFIDVYHENSLAKIMVPLAVTTTFHDDN